MKLSKKEAEEKIRRFFENKNEQEAIKKIKKLAMHFNIKLRGYRKRFCRNCYSSLENTGRIKNKMKIVKCKNCGYVNRWKI